VEVLVEPASVHITITLTPTPGVSAVEVASSLQNALGTPEQASSLLGISVTDVSIVGPTLSPPSPPSTGGAATGGAGADPLEWYVWLLISLATVTGIGVVAWALTVRDRRRKMGDSLSRSRVHPALEKARSALGDSAKRLAATVAAAGAAVSSTVETSVRSFRLEREPSLGLVDLEVSVPRLEKKEGVGPCSLLKQGAGAIVAASL
jgi:hypothetical protein